MYKNHEKYLVILTFTVAILLFLSIVRKFFGH